MKRKAIEAAYNDMLPAPEAPSWQEDPDLMEFLNSLARGIRCYSKMGSDFT